MNTTTPQKRVITIDTNFNGKMDCQHFIHLDLAPMGRLTEEIADKNLIEIKTKDGSHPPVVCRLVDLARFPLVKTNQAFTMVSHGMMANEFINYTMAKYQNVTPSTEMAIYCYKKHLVD